MSLKSVLSLKISNVVSNLNSIVEELIRRSLVKTGYLPALVGSEQSLPTGKKFDLKEIFEKGIVWCPTPKKRTTAEKKLTKRFLPLPNNFITKYSRPKTNIITCIECGSYYEKGTLCGTCYEKVKLETEKIQNELQKDDKFKYKYPTGEVNFLYEDDKKEDLTKNDKQVFVEIPGKRPSWFHSNLFSRVSTKVNK